MDLRGYERERGPDGPSLEDQRKALKAAGVPAEDLHPPIYTDLRGKGKRGLLTQRAHAIKSLRGGTLVVYDAATLGRDADEINEALMGIGQNNGILVVLHPSRREFRWHPEAAEMAALVAEGASINKAEKHRRAAGKRLHLGAQPKLVGEVLNIARKAWADPELTANQAADKVREYTRVKVSARTLWNHLGKKSEAEGTISLPPPVAPVPKKAKKRPKRRKEKPKAVPASTPIALATDEDFSMEGFMKDITDA